MHPTTRRFLGLSAVAVLGAAGCGEARIHGTGSASGPPPKVHETIVSPDGRWQLTRVERHPDDPGLKGTTWQLLLGPVGMSPDSAKPVFDAQDLVPAATWRTADSVDIVASGPVERLAAMPESWHTMNTMLGRDGQRHSFAFAVVAKAR